MSQKPALLLTAPPASARAASALGLPIAHLAYRVGSGPHLFRSSMPISIRGGLMAVDSTGFDGRGTPESLCREILRECAVRGFDGILCIFEGRPVPLLCNAVHTLGELASRRGWPVYVPESYAPFSDKTRILISSALSGGSLLQKLQDAAEQYRPERLTLAVERVAEDFFLPSPTGQGTPLTREELRSRLQARDPAVFFSPELCAHYFTYMSRQNGAHFVLFDTADSVRRKLQLAHSLGITRAALDYGQMDDLLPDILSGL